MPDNKQLKDEELEKVAGGFMGPNKYTMEEYHEAGLVTDWSAFHYDVFSLYAGNGIMIGEWMRCDVANTYVEYYKTHTQEEYVEWIRATTNFKNYTYNRGYDIS